MNTPHPLSTVTAFVRSTVYHVVFTAVTLLMGLLCLPLLTSRHQALKSSIPYIWTRISLLLQRAILGLHYRVHGLENIPKGRTVFAVKHQSAWETLALWHILNRPVFVLKKELLDIPVFGWYLRQADNIVIDRNKGQKAIGQIIEQSMVYLTRERHLVIFPEGTRTEVGTSPNYKYGIGNLYEALAPPVVPVAHNAGCFWPRNSYLRRPGVIDITFLPVIDTGLPKAQFMEELKTSIETTTQELIESADYRW